MTAHPRFVCRREGHDPEVSFSGVRATFPGAAFFSVCRRCGGWVEFPAEVVKAEEMRASEVAPG